MACYNKCSMRGETETIDLDALLGASRRTLVATAHELKAPLSLIRLYASQLENDLLTEAQRKQYSARLLFTAEQMLQLTTGLLEGYRWGQGRLPLEPVNTAIMCEEVLHELTPAAYELNQQLHYLPTKHTSVAVGHPLLLKNVLFNIVFNALKHTPAGTRVMLSSTCQGERAHLSVTDTGPGFAKNVAQHLDREAGERLQVAPSHGSSGLGLAVAKQLMGAMNGTLSIKASRRGGYCVASLRASRQLTLPL